MTVLPSEIAAARAAEKLQQKIKLQEKLIPKGQMSVNALQQESLLSNITNSQVQRICTTWSYFIKYADHFGVGIMVRCLEKNPRLIKLFPKLMAGKTRPRLVNLRSNSNAVPYGRSLILHVTDIITNLRNNASLDSFIKSKFNLMYNAGFTTDDIKMCQETLLAYLAESLPSQWTPEMYTAWKNMTNEIVFYGTQNRRTSLVDGKSCARGTKRRTPLLITLPSDAMTMFSKDSSEA